MWRWVNDMLWLNITVYYCDLFKPNWLFENWSIPPWKWPRWGSSDIPKQVFAFAVRRSWSSKKNPFLYSLWLWDVSVLPGLSNSLFWPSPIPETKKKWGGGSPFKFKQEGLPHGPEAKTLWFPKQRIQGSIPGQGTKFNMLQLRVHMPLDHSGMT